MIKKFLTLFLVFSVIFTIASCMPVDEDYFVVKFYSESVEFYTQKVVKGDSLSEPNQPEKEDFTFLYWVDDKGEQYTFGEPVTRDLVLTAIFEPKQIAQVNKYKVRFFDLDGNQVGEDQMVNEGSSARAPALPPEEFFVLEWDKSYDRISKDVDIYAVRRYVASSSDLFTYELKGNSYAITGIAEGAELPHMPNGFVKLALPESYNDLPITSIGEGAFENKNIYAVYIPSCYMSIGANAFKANSPLSIVVFNEGLMEIGEGAFMASNVSGYVFTGSGFANPGSPVYVSNITQLEFPSSLLSIGDYAFYEIGRLCDNNNMLELTVNVDFGKCKNLAYIGDHAFEGVMLQSLKIPETKYDLHIGDYAFAADTYLNWVFTNTHNYPRSQLTTISLPSSLKHLGDYAFYGCGQNNMFYNGQIYQSRLKVFLNCEKFDLNYLGAGSFFDVFLTGTLNLTVESIGDYAFYNHNLSDVNLSGVKSIGEYSFAKRNEEAVPFNLQLGDSVVSIGNGAFYNNTGLKTVTFPSGLVQIGDSAFENCKMLEGNVVFPSSLTTVGAYAFAMTNIRSVRIEGSVKFMRYCFLQCSSLTEITGTIEFVDIGTFCSCVSLQKLTLPSEMSKIPYMLFYDCEALETVKLPEALIEVGDNAFYGCISLDTITIPSGVNRIGQGAFEYCLFLRDVKFDGNMLKTLDKYSFAFCINLTSIALPDSVERISDFAFAGTGLTSFVTPAALQTMGYGVFCQQEYSLMQKDENGNEVTTNITLPFLESIVISSETGSIEFDVRGTFYGSSIEGFEVEVGNKVYDALDGILYSADHKKLIMYIRGDFISEIEIAEGLEEIENGAFMNCTSLKAIKFPSSLVTIGEYAFYNCPKLRSVSFPAKLKSIGAYAFASSSDQNSMLSEIRFEGNSIEEIGAYAFAYNSALISISIPESLTSIGNNAFYNCSSLKNIDLSNAKSLTSIGNMAFSGSSYLTAPKITSLNFSACVNLKGTGVYAFSKCSQLESINFGNVDKVDQGSFADCSGLRRLQLGSNISSIGGYSFSRCTNLSNIIIPQENVLSQISEYAFAGSYGQNMNFSRLDLTYATNLSLIKEGAFAYGNVKEVILPASPFTLGDEVFDQCVKLQSIDFGGVREIGENVLRFCNNIKTLNIPSSVNTIGKDAFRDLKIETVNIGSPESGNNIFNLGKNTFFNCKNLKTVNIYGTNVPVLSGNEYNMSFHYLDNYGVQNLIVGLNIVVDHGMKAVYLGSSHSGNGWRVYESLLTERSAATNADAQFNASQTRRKNRANASAFEMRQAVGI